MGMQSVQKFKRGQIWWLVDATPNYNYHEQRGSRPVIIVSNDSANRFSRNVAIVPCTTADKKDLPTHVKLEINGPSTALAENITTVDKMKLGSYVGTCDAKLVLQIDEAIKVALGLTKLAYEIEQEDTMVDNLKSDIDIKTFSSADEPKKETRGRKRISPEEKIRFINDYENHDCEYMMKKYNIATKAAVKTRIHDYRKAIEEAS